MPYNRTQKLLSAAFLVASTFGVAKAQTPDDQRLLNNEKLAACSIKETQMKGPAEFRKAIRRSQESLRESYKEHAFTNSTPQQDALESIGQSEWLFRLNDIVRQSMDACIREILSDSSDSSISEENINRHFNLDLWMKKLDDTRAEMTKGFNTNDYDRERAQWLLQQQNPK